MLMIVWHHPLALSQGTTALLRLLALLPLPSFLLSVELGWVPQLAASRTWTLMSWAWDYCLSLPTIWLKLMVGVFENFHYLPAAS